jgi:ABC-type transport system involved in cytochrome c biogenesis ATPase subunit
MNQILDELESWFTQRPRWLQDAARRIIQNGAVDEKDLRELVTLCKNEVGIDGLSEFKIAPVGIPKDALQIKNDKAALRLKAISEVKGINALAPQKPLEFGDAPLTIVYGLNGSGKSGYVRALKHACGAKRTGPLHNNVFSNASQQQGCKLLVTIDSQVKEFIWTPQNGIIHELKSIEIYDTECAHVYVNEENEVAYEPSLLLFFSQLTDACGKVSQALKDEIDRNISKKPTFPVELGATEGSKWYNQLNHYTAKAQIEEKCQWSQQLENELGELKKRLAETNPAEMAKMIRKRKDNLLSLHDDLKKMLDNLSDQKCSDYLTAKKDAIAKRKAASEDAKKVFENAPLEGVGAESWKLLWEQARAYSENIVYKGVAFPNVADDARCVLCQQTLDLEAKQRFVSFEQFVKGKLQNEAEKAEVLQQKLEDNLGNIPDAKTLELRMDSASIVDELERQQIVSFCDFLAKRKESLLAAAILAEVSLLPNEDILTRLSNRILTLENQSATYEEDAKRENRESSERRAKELEAQKWLSQQVESIKAEVERLKHIQKLESARTLTNTQALSVKKSELADQLITTSYINRFKEELKALGASRIRVEIVKTRTERGHVFHKIKLMNCSREVRTSEVLSEGEFRIVSLATFLADIEGRGQKTPFIFDDPISSLDQDFEEATVARIVKLCKSRQVIVFTHRLSMLALLEEAVKKQEIEPNVTCLRNEYWGIGEPSEAPIFAKRTDKALNLFLSERLPKARKIRQCEGQDAYEQIAKAICSDVRILVERMIELDLLADVVQRFRRSVITKDKLHKLARISAEDCKFFDDLMTKYSCYEHSQPYETPVSMPDPDEIEKDLKEIKNWHEEFTKRVSKLS